MIPIVTAQVTKILGKFIRLPVYVATREEFLAETNGIIQIIPRIMIYDPSEPFPDYEAQLIYTSVSGQNSQYPPRTKINYMAPQYLIGRNRLKTAIKEEVSELERLAENHRKTLEVLCEREAIVHPTLLNIDYRPKNF